MLDQAKFELGVHGLEHDGKLYRSKAGFAAKASRINRYLKKWNCVGFRSPLMQHRLEWLHALNVEYDASTFDTDPFEPQPDGVGTIFPFWVHGPNESGYVELPYTLVQDFSLFVVLRERTIDTWKRKVDWIAEQGGMILINTHPDYMCFEGQPKLDDYPVSYYEDLLRYIRERYSGCYWPALPREVARYYREKVPLTLRNTRRKICVITYALYEDESGIRPYAEALAQNGDRVDVVAGSGTHSEPSMSQVNGVGVYRVNGCGRKSSASWSRALRLLQFFVSCSRELTRLHKLNRYDIVQFRNVPYCLVFAAWYPKLNGAALNLDIRGHSPQLLMSKMCLRLKASYLGLARSMEKISLRFVDQVIVSDEPWLESATGRSFSEKPRATSIDHVDSTCL